VRSFGAVVPQAWAFPRAATDCVPLLSPFTWNLKPETWNFLMTGFQLYATAILIAAVALLPVHYVAVARRQPRPAHGDRSVRRYGLWERLVHLALLASFLALACTGFYASIAWGGPMKGYLLMLHTTAGAVLAVTMALSLLTWAADHAFNRADGRWMKAGGCLSTRGDLPAARFNASEKLYFWLAGLLTLVALMSMLMSMIKVLGHAWK
jgi:hypothetical protein